jgi:hypothetical protein
MGARRGELDAARKPRRARRKSPPERSKEHTMTDLFRMRWDTKAHLANALDDYGFIRVLIFLLCRR